MHLCRWPHYRVCFIERGLSARACADRDANHALVMAQADAGMDFALRRPMTPRPNARSATFRRGHHLFDAADSAFSAHLSGAEMAELRRWIRGPEGRRRRARGLGEAPAISLGRRTPKQAALEEALAASSALAGEGWLARMRAGRARTGEVFWHMRMTSVARSADAHSAYDIEAQTRPLPPEVLKAAPRA